MQRTQHLPCWERPSCCEPRTEKEADKVKCARARHERVRCAQHLSHKFAALLTIGFVAACCGECLCPSASRQQT